jgi:hypothetical protein
MSHPRGLSDHKGARAPRATAAACKLPWSLESYMVSGEIVAHRVPWAMTAGGVGAMA